MTDSPALRSAWRSLLLEQRYRRAFLAADARQNAALVLVTSLATIALARNDFRLLEGHLLFLSVGVRAVHVVVSIFVFERLRRSRSPQQHDRAASLWLWATTALALSVCLTRLPVGEFHGPLVTLAALLCALLFAQRSPVRQRVLVSAGLVGTALVMSWHPRSTVTPTVATTTTICFIALSTVGLLSARAFEEQRRQRVRAEHEERCSRRALAAKVGELAAEKERVEALSHARATFLATMSHEFRTPMNAVIGLSTVMLEDATTPHREHVRTIHDSARGLLVLLEDVLDFAKIDAGRVSLAPAPFELRRLVASVADMLRPSIEGRGLAIDVDVGDAVPLLVVADEARLRQVLVNLVSNAAKFTDRGAIRLAISVDATDGSRGESALRIEVADTGVGMSPATIQRLFEPFYQAEHGAARRYGGTGLGLAMSREIVRAMGSEIVVESELGRGSSFSFLLRVRTGGAELLPPAASPASGRDRASGERAHLAILVVDDEPINCMVVTAMLERFGLRPELASNGPEAIAALADKAYDLVLMDVHMPGMSGLETTRTILRSSSRDHAPLIVAMTASAFEDDRDACREAGMRGFMAKPLEPAELAATLHRADEERRARTLGASAEVAGG